MNKEAFTDGACRKTNPGECAAAWAYYEDGVLVDDSAWTIDGLNTNNWAEYQGVIGLLEYLTFMETDNVTIHCDSKLVVCQINGLWQVRDTLIEPCTRAQRFMRMGLHTLVHVKGHAGIEGNEYCDALCNKVLDEATAKEKVSA